MKLLSLEEKELLLKLLIEDQPFSLIKKKLGLNKNYNLKSLCEYLGKKYMKAYELHINNFCKNEVAIPNNENLTKEDFFKGMEMVISQIKFNEENNERLLKLESTNHKEIEKNDDIFEIIQLPKVLPLRLQGTNYQVRQTSVKVVDNIWQEFQQFTKTNKTYTSIEYLSLAILEFLEKYRA